VNAAYLGDFQKICACDEEGIDGLVGLFCVDSPNGKRSFLVLFRSRHAAAL
jgi:hypothetical protein